MSQCKDKGHVHSIETFGTVDGPGIRFVVFFQGCPMRCLYCHNPDTWEPSGGNEMTVQEILERFLRNQSFYAKGGITATGGEPLLQLPFLTELFHEAKSLGIHTCLDTSGSIYRKADSNDFEDLFSYTDLVMLDIKTSDPILHKTLTGCELEPVLSFASALEKHHVPLRIRHVIVPGITYEQEKLYHLGRTISRFTNLKELEVLPYHAMGVKKYEALGIPYPLKDTKALTKEDALNARKMILAGIQAERKLNL